MCRLAAYIGPDIPLQQFLLEPDHSLYKQSWEPRELKYTKLNADGYGFGWFTDDAAPSAYTSSQPIWSDSNLPALARTLRFPLWLAEVRSATDGTPVHPFNTAPFYDDRLLYTHNGFIRDFHLRLLPEVTALLSPEVHAGIRGNTDSEYLFACLRQFLLDAEEPDITGALQKLYAWLAPRIGEQQALLNLVVSDGERIYATRHGYNHECASLYYTTDDELFPGGQLVASERFSKDSFWQPVPEHHLLILDPHNPPELLAL
jgi:glutamine amidotransferase